MSRGKEVVSVLVTSSLVVGGGVEVARAAGIIPCGYGNGEASVVSPDTTNRGPEVVVSSEVEETADVVYKIEDGVNELGRQRVAEVAAVLNRLVREGRISKSIYAVVSIKGEHKAGSTTFVLYTRDGGVEIYLPDCYLNLGNELLEPEYMVGNLVGAMATGSLTGEVGSEERYRQQEVIVEEVMEELGRK